MKNSNNTIGNQTRDLPTCGAVLYIYIYIYIYSCVLTSSVCCIFLRPTLIIILNFVLTQNSTQICVEIGLVASDYHAFQT